MHDGHQLLREVVRGYTAAQGCDDLAATSGPADSVIIARATLDGWLQNRVGAVEPGSYPTAAVAATVTANRRRKVADSADPSACRTDLPAANAMLG